MEDEAGGDMKILAVPIDKLSAYYKGVETYRDVPEITLAQIAHFFQHYKDLEKGKWVTISKWEGPSGAAQLIRDGIARVQGIAVPPAPAVRARKRTPRKGSRR
jgi:inorganic pyrophosphatase